MPKIRLLSEEVRSKIAAGEVIIRPVSVIKELIENSLDAGAKRIEIEIEKGGKAKCLVNDDGFGMSRADALLSIERYATSKIERIEDIENIKTFGFRGEALASIAQVSHFELETFDGSEGTKIIVEEGKVKQVIAIFREKGTRVKVSDLFYNLPARRKFLKSDEYERRLIIDLVKTYAIISPEVHIILGEEQRNILNLPSVKDLKSRLLQLYPARLVEKLIPFELNVGEINFYGFLSPFSLNEKLNLNLVYVNSRPVRYPRITRLISEIYQNPKEPPLYVLNIKIPPRMLDVNIHPTKNEVKIKEERYVMDLLTQGIKSKIFPATPVKEYPSELASSADVRLVQESLIPYSEMPTKTATTAGETGDFWQLHNTYIFAQTSTGLIIIDQHVAHERILYESIMNNRGSSQHLLFPITIELTPEEYRIYQMTKESLKELGIEFKEFSARTLVIDTLPSDTKVTREDFRGFFSEIGSLGKLMHQKSELAKVIACRMAIKAGQKLSVAEMQSLIDRLFACENPFVCPHGRPIVIKISLDDLDKRFGR
ncbi:MAG: DNA mismatch repair endonuclease MutL [candidate division WOR-3 bacterium]